MENGEWTNQKIGLISTDFQPQKTASRQDRKPSGLSHAFRVEIIICQ